MERVFQRSFERSYHYTIGNTGGKFKDKKYNHSTQNLPNSQNMKESLDEI